MIILTSSKAISTFRLRALRGALKLEIAGMRRHGESAYSIVKREFGFRGNKTKVLEQLDAYIKSLPMPKEEK